MAVFTQLYWLAKFVVHKRCIKYLFVINIHFINDGTKVNKCAATNPVIFCSWIWQFCAGTAKFVDHQIQKIFTRRNQATVITSPVLYYALHTTPHTIWWCIPTCVMGPNKCSTWSLSRIGLGPFASSVRGFMYDWREGDRGGRRGGVSHITV